MKIAESVEAKRERQIQSHRERSKQYQLKNLENGKCKLCPKKLYKWKLCRRHFRAAKAAYDMKALEMGRRPQKGRKRIV